MYISQRQARPFRSWTFYPIQFCGSTAGKIETFFQNNLNVSNEQNSMTDGPVTVAQTTLKINDK